jgi:hypothetical protein
MISPTRPGIQLTSSLAAKRQSRRVTACSSFPTGSRSFERTRPLSALLSTPISGRIGEALRTPSTGARYRMPSTGHSARVASRPTPSTGLPLPSRTSYPWTIPTLDTPSAQGYIYAEESLELSAA